MPNNGPEQWPPWVAGSLWPLQDTASHTGRAICLDSLQLQVHVAGMGDTQQSCCSYCKTAWG